MKEIQELLRTVLISNSTLTTSVSTLQIKTSYANRPVVYPSITFGLDSGVEGTNIEGLQRAVISVDIRAKAIGGTKSATWNIYELVRGILHNKESSFPTTTYSVHVCVENGVRDNIFDQGHEVHIITSSYTVMWSVKTLGITSGVDGEIYGHATSVTTASANKIGEFSGGVSIQTDWSQRENRGLEQFPNNYDFHIAGAILSVQGVVFKSSIIDLIWGVSATTGHLNNGTTNATIRMIDNTIEPQGVQLLFRMKKTSNQKYLEIKAYKAFCDVLPIVFPKHNISVTDLNFKLGVDTSGYCYKISEEN